MEIELRQVLRAAIRWGWLVLLVSIISGVLAYTMTSRQSATYSATSTLLVNPQQVTGTADSGSLQASRSQAETYVRLVGSRPVLNRVISELSLPYSATQLADKIDARVVVNTQLIEISVSDAAPDEAARVANAVAGQFEVHVEDLTIGRLQENLAQMDREIATLQSRQTEIETELAALDTDANADNAEVQQQVLELREEQNRGQQTLADLDSSVRTLNQQLATTTSPIEIADEATAAREPDSPKPMLMTALGLFLGLLVGSALAGLLQLLDKKVRQETDIEELTGSRLLAVIPGEKWGAPGEPFVLSQPNGSATEAVRMLRTRLGSVAVRGSHSAIVFTSAGGDGATTGIVTNLGVVMAQAGLKTIVMDANGREPNGRPTALPAGAGTSSALAEGQGRVPSLSVPDSLDRLRIVTAVQDSTNPAEMPGSAAFAELLYQTRSEADVVLVDTPPALTYSDALSVAALSDGVVIIGRYGSTSRDDISCLAETVQADGMRLHGVVMIRG